MVEEAVEEVQKAVAAGHTVTAPVTALSVWGPGQVGLVLHKASSQYGDLAGGVAEALVLGMVPVDRKGLAAAAG